MLALPSCRVQLSTIPTNQPDPWISLPQFISLINLVSIACKSITLGYRLICPKRLPRAPGGRPDVYPDIVVFITIVVMYVWCLSPRKMANWLKRWPGLAIACGYQPYHTISASQLSRRMHRFGLAPYFAAFVLLVAELIAAGIIIGKDIIIDSSTFLAWSKRDGDAAWDYAKRFGYKIHTVICRASLLPLMFVITPANCHDVTLAIPLLEAVRRLYRLPVEVVRADSAYFSKVVIGYIRVVLKAAPRIDYNLRRKGKKALATLEFIAWWRSEKGKRGYIERYFALLKRYYGLTEFQVMGLEAVMCHALLINIKVLCIALVAVKVGRPDLMHSPTRLLAPC